MNINKILSGSSESTRIIPFQETFKKTSNIFKDQAVDYHSGKFIIVLSRWMEKKGKRSGFIPYSLISAGTKN